jgi:hypothetical protein
MLINRAYIIMAFACSGQLEQVQVGRHGRVVQSHVMSECRVEQSQSVEKSGERSSSVIWNIVQVR